VAVVAVAVAALALSASAAHAAGGWVVRICRGGTEAAGIKITVAKPGGKEQALIHWKSDVKETDFPVSDTTIAAGDQLQVKADSDPPDGQVAMCVMYDGNPVKAMNFNDLMEVTASKTGKDDTCQCAKGQ
jgi:hypothetical protein